MSPAPDAELDRLADALAGLLADWWRRRERQAAGAIGAAAGEEPMAIAGHDPKREAPARTGAGEIHPEHRTRKDTTS